MSDHDIAMGPASKDGRHIILLRNQQIIRVRHQGLKLQEIAAMFGISMSTVHRVVGPKKSQGPSPYRFWTEARCIEAICHWAERWGEPPRALDWRVGAHDHPNSKQVIDRFGSWNKGIEAAGFLPRSRERRTCSVEGCDHPHQGLGLCNTHYAQVYRARMARRRVGPYI
jgi:hypothetical protein